MGHDVKFEEKTNPNWFKVVKEIEKMKKNPTVKLGVLAWAGMHHTDDGAVTSITIAQIATWAEFGTETEPQRSFIRATIEEHHDELVQFINKLATKIYSGEMEAEHALGLIGQKGVALVKKRIADGIDPENAPSTIARKGSSKPLVDTGQLRASVSYETVEHDSEQAGNGEMASGI